MVPKRLWPPHDQERVADILVGLSSIVVAGLMHDLTDAVREEHHLPFMVMVVWEGERRVSGGVKGRGGWRLSARVRQASKRAQHAYLILQALYRIGKLPDVAEAVRAFPVVCWREGGV